MVYSFSSPTQPLDDKNVESVRFCTSPSFELATTFTTRPPRTNEAVFPTLAEKTMSSLLRVYAPRSAAPFLVQRATFSHSITRAVAKESALHSEGRAEEIETKQREQAQKREEGQGHWDESLASDGEAAVKADRSETGKDVYQYVRGLEERARSVGKQEDTKAERIAEKQVEQALKKARETVEQAKQAPKQAPKQASKPSKRASKK